MTIAIVPLERAADGSLTASLSAVFTTRDLQTVESLSPFSAAPAQVIVDGVARTLTVYRQGTHRAFINAADLE